MEITKTNLIPFYLEASDKEELVKLMYANNVSNGFAYNYMSPLKDGKKWVVWFYADIENYKKPDRKLLGLKDVEIK